MFLVDFLFGWNNNLKEEKDWKKKKILNRNERNDGRFSLGNAKKLDILRTFLDRPNPHLKGTSQHKNPRSENVASNRERNPSENLESVIRRNNEIKEAAFRLNILAFTRLSKARKIKMSLKVSELANHKTCNTKIELKG